jgi:hypothetical protein
MSPAFVSPSRAFFISLLFDLLISHQCYATKTVCSSLIYQFNSIQFPFAQGWWRHPLPHLSLLMNTNNNTNTNQTMDTTAFKFQYLQRNGYPHSPMATWNQQQDTRWVSWGEKRPSGIIKKHNTHQLVKGISLHYTRKNHGGCYIAPLSPKKKTQSSQ